MSFAVGQRVTVSAHIAPTRMAHTFVGKPATLVVLSPAGSPVAYCQLDTEHPKAYTREGIGFVKPDHPPGRYYIAVYLDDLLQLVEDDDNIVVSDR